MISLLLALAASTQATAAVAPDSPPALLGKPAPGFVLPSDRGDMVRLSAFRGKKTVVLAFFPKAFTPG